MTADVYLNVVEIFKSRLQHVHYMADLQHSTAVFLLRVPEISIENLDES